ncbi:FCS-Like Zinc finger 10 [Ricinus communis]|uniref:FCS-Like Zinc finger 10 n=1 Tax=Ricinus communis TaxID=3988 RepID=UPI00201B32A8|nr:FCS-Like Zinc finger 10 [Ricinus communis]
MLRKRTRSLQKDQQMGPLTMSDSGSQFNSQSDCLGYNHKRTSFFNVPGLFVGLSPKGMSDCDSVRSPTSPLDLRLFSNLGNSSYRSPRSSQNGHQKSWDCSKVGLSIVNSLDDEDDDTKVSGKVLRSSESKNILFGQKVRIKTPTFQVNANSFEAPKSLPRNFAILPHSYTKSSLQKGCSKVIFEIGEAPTEPEHFGKIRSCSLDSCKSFSTLSRLANRNSNVICGNFPLNNVATGTSSPLQFSGGSPPQSNNSLHMDLNLPPAGSTSGFVGSLSASEIELSEDYTCVISHGPNARKTHIYGDCVLECYSNEGKEIRMPQAITSSIIPSPFPSNDFLNFCYYCNRRLDGGKDIYIYRGEKAFCSLSCRSEEIMIDEEMEKTTNKTCDEPEPPKCDNGEELYENGIFDAP